MALVGPNGNPISSRDFAKPSDNLKPVMGEAFGNWAGRDLQYVNLPGGGVMQFDLSSLTLADYRLMSNHYQVNSSLSVLMFMLHQLDWHVECSDPKIVEHVEQNVGNIWTRLVRAMSQAFWAGYSPNILQWENDLQGNTIQLTKIKDIPPEEAFVNWKSVDGTIPPGAPTGAVPPKIKVFDGIKVAGMSHAVPTTNSFWYPLLMENGNYLGRKLLKAAFQPWFFSTLMHLFSNRYYERFGEPVPIGRAPFGEDIVAGGKTVMSEEYMAQAMQSLRSRSVVVLPSDRAIADTGAMSDKFEYEMSYLESQMRGADFERYMTRLDEEISLALFTPLLLMRTADVGSYNLGVSHMQMYLWQLNAIAGDWAEYINKYILAPMADFNFGESAPRPKIVFHQMGKTQAETTRAILSALVNKGDVKVDLQDLGQATGLSLEEVEGLTGEDEDTRDRDEGREGRVRDDAGPDSVADKITLRVRKQAERAFRNGSFGNGFVPEMGHTSQVPQDKLPTLMELNEALAADASAYSSVPEFMETYGALVKGVLDE